MNVMVLLLILVLGVAGLGSIAAGVYLLFGLGWALIYGGAALLLVTDLLRRGAA